MAVIIKFSWGKHFGFVFNHVLGSDGRPLVVEPHTEGCLSLQLGGGRTVVKGGQL